MYESTDMHLNTLYLNPIYTKTEANVIAYYCEIIF